MKRIVWTAAAKADVRSLSKPTAMQILTALHRFAESGVGNVKSLQGREELGFVSETTGCFLSVPSAIASKSAVFIIEARPTAERRWRREVHFFPKRHNRYCESSQVPNLEPGRTQHLRKIPRDL